MNRILTSLLLIVAFSQISFAQSGKYRPSSDISKTKSYKSNVKYDTYKLLIGNGDITLLAPEQYNYITKIFKKKLLEYNDEFTKLFGEIPKFNVKIELMPDKYFFQKTNAPNWTNALYYKNSVMIPLGDNIDLNSILKALKHEYSHAVINSLTSGRCPGWLDEGLAQWVEGEENPALSVALNDWLTTNKPIPLSMLQGGFTKLKSDMVPAAYAQSLFSVNAVISAFGLEKLQVFFKKLREGESQHMAFQDSFSISILDYQRYLKKLLFKWHSH